MSLFVTIQKQWIELIFISHSHPIEMLGMYLNGIRSVMISLNNPQNYGLDTNMGHFLIIFTGQPFLTSIPRVKGYLSSRL